MMRLTDEGHKVAMKNATKLPAGTIVLRSGGNLYVMHDKKLPNRKMFFDNSGVWLAQP